MPIHVVIDKRLRLVIGTASGCITLSDITAHQDKLLSDPDFSPDFNQLMDGSRITDWRLSIDDVEFVAHRKVFSSSSKRAIVAPQPSNSPLARIIVAYHKLTDHLWNVRLFEDVPSALNWLGIDALPEIKIGA